MRENVTISYRGASYEIGRGPHFYGIWVVGAPQPQPVEWWPETPEGWSSAWARFTAIEAPGTIAAVRPAASGATRPAPWTSGPAPGPATQPGMSQPGTTQPVVSSQAFPAGGPSAQPVMATQATQATMTPTPVGDPAALAAQPGMPAAAPPDQPTGWAGQLAKARAQAGWQAMAAAGLLVLGVVLGIASLFPTYLYGASLASNTSNLVPHVIYLLPWAGGAALIALGGARMRLGALLAAGTSIVTFGLFVADAGYAIAYGSRAGAGAGLVLGLLGWLACAIGSGLAVRAQLTPASAAGSGRPQKSAVKHLLTIVAALAALGTAITFAPSWDGYTLRIASGASSYQTAGNAFANPGWVITGDLLTMIAVVLVVVVAALWRPVREGAWLLAGAVIPMAAQAISALILVGQPTSPAQFGFSQSEASAAGLTITNSLTPAFWLFCGFVLVLMLGCVWLLVSPRATALDRPAQRHPHGPADGPPGGWPYAWPHPFAGGTPGTPQAGSPQPGFPQPGAAQPWAPQAGQQSAGAAQPDAPRNTGLDILDPDRDNTDPDILDSAQGKVEPGTPEHGAGD